MAVPKKKTSKSRRNMRRSHHALTPRGLCRMPELRRAEAAASCLRRLRPLRRPRSGAAQPRRRPEPRPGGRARARERRHHHRPRRHGRRPRPGMVLKGAEHRAAALSRSVRFPAVRRREPRSRRCWRSCRAWRRRATIHHTDEVGDRRRQAVAGAARRPAARACGWRSMRSPTGEADGVVSAGNTGALMAMAKFVLKTLPGIDRPAIAIVLPDPARRERDARSRRQCRMRRREPRAVRADGRRLRPHRAGLAAADRRPAQCRLRGSEGQRRGARRQRPAARRRLRRSTFTASSRATTSPPARSTWS